MQLVWALRGPREHQQQCRRSVPLDDTGWKPAVLVIYPPQLPEMELGVLEIRWGPRELKLVPLEGASSTEWSSGVVQACAHEPAVWPCTVGNKTVRMFESFGLCI
jgi:hypothetical protein